MYHPPPPPPHPLGGYTENIKAVSKIVNIVALDKETWLLEKTVVYESLFYINYVHGFMFSMPTNENFKYAKNFLIGLQAERRKKNLGVCHRSLGLSTWNSPWKVIFNSDWWLIETSFLSRNIICEILICLFSL